MERLLKNIKTAEDEHTVQLLREFKSLRKQGYLEKKQLIPILKWKSPRPLKHYEANSDASVKEITKLAFEAKNDSLKIHILTALKGVNYPAASAIMMFYDQKRYPVLDIRVWQQLYKARLVSTNAKGQNFSLEEVQIYFEVIRELAKKLNLPAREVEKRIFDHDRKTRQGKLYR